MLVVLVKIILVHFLNGRLNVMQIHALRVILNWQVIYYKREVSG